MGITKLLSTFSDVLWFLPENNVKKISSILKYKMDNDSISLFKEMYEKKMLDTGINDSDELTIRLIDNGKTLFFPIDGILMPRVSWLDTLCGFQSTINLHNKLEMIVKGNENNFLNPLNSLVPSDNNLVGFENILFYITSPGGASTGIPEFAEYVYSLRDKYNTVTFSDEILTSAAYYIGSASKQVITTPTTIVGSIGTYQEIIKMKPESMDYDTYIIRAGKRKVAGHPEIPLQEGELDYFQEQVNLINDIFISSVAKYRDISEETVRNTEAAASEAIIFPDGFVDELVPNINAILND